MMKRESKRPQNFFYRFRRQKQRFALRGRYKPRVPGAAAIRQCSPDAVQREAMHR
jgi:hypothetical protein